MQNEEYGEALVLAQQYGLDCDLVYLRQWRSYPVTIATIEDYLVSIHSGVKVYIDSTTVFVLCHKEHHTITVTLLTHYSV